jgi:hypothetical protein
MAWFALEAAAGWALAIVAIVRWFSVVSCEPEEEATEATLSLNGPLSGAIQTAP